MSELHKDKFVSIDLGTTSIKIFLFDEDGMLIRSYMEPINIINVPEIGGVEHRPEEVYHKVFNGLKHVVRGFEGGIVGITFSSYGYSLMGLGHNYTPLFNILTYLDARAKDDQNVLEAYGRELYERTGCPPLYIYPIAKLLWLKRRGLLGSIKRISFVKDYIIYMLSRHKLWHVDLSTASTTGLLNTHKLSWDDLALEIVGMDESYLPELIDGARLLDYISVPELNLGKVAISLGAMDGTLQNLAYSLYGDEAAMNLGSSAALRALCKDVVIDRCEMRLYHYYVADNYRVTGAIFNNGMSVIDWFRNITNLSDWGLIRGVIRKSPACRDGIYVLPFAMGETLPFRAQYMKFSVLGLTLSSTLGDLFRALFEGLGFLFKEIINALMDNGIHVNSVHCGGGGCLIGELIDTISEVICRPIVTYGDEVSRAASALGALATLLRSLNYVSDVKHVRFDNVVRSRSVVTPSKDLCGIYDECLNDFIRTFDTVKHLYRR